MGPCKTQLDPGGWQRAPNSTKPSSQWQLCDRCVFSEQIDTASTDHMWPSTCQHVLSYPWGRGREADPLPSDGQEAAFIVVTQDPGNALPPGHGAGKGVRTVPQVLHVGDITVSDQMRPPDWRPWENVRVPEGSERDPREGSGAPHQRETSGSRTEPLLGHNGKMTASRTLPHPIGKNFRRDTCRAGDIGLIRILGFCLEAGRGGS